MRNIGRWLQIAETAEKIRRTDDTGYAVSVLSMSTMALVHSGYPYVKTENDFIMELNGKEVNISKQPAYVETEAILKLKEEHAVLVNENKKLKRMLKIMLAENDPLDAENYEEPLIKLGACDETNDTAVDYSRMEADDTDLEDVEDPADTCMEEEPTAAVSEDTGITEKESASTEESTKPEKTHIAIGTEEDRASTELNLEEAETEPYLDETIIDDVYDESDEKNNDTVEDITEVEEKQKGKETQEAKTEEKAEGSNSVPVSTIGREETKSDDMAGYKESMDLSELALSYCAMELRQMNSSTVVTLEMVISPLSMKEGKSDIIVWASDGANQKYYVSDERKGVLVSFGSVGVIVDGSVVGGKFQTKFKLPRQLKKLGVTIDVKETMFNGTGHNMICEDEVAVHVVPLSDKNRSDGMADFVYAILVNGEVTVLGDSFDKTEVHFDFRGIEHRLLAKWADKRLYTAVKPV